MLTTRDGVDPLPLTERERTISGMRGDAATAAAEVVIDSYVSEKEREEGNAAATKTFSQLTFRGRQKQHRKKEHSEPRNYSSKVA